MTDGGEDKGDLLIDLNFVPTWARNPPSSNPYLHGGGGDRPERSERFDRPDRPSRDAYQPGRRPGGPRRDQRPPPRGRGPEPVWSGGRPAAAAPDPRDGREGRDAAAAAAQAALDAVEVTFLPERRGLAPLAHRLAHSARAYSLFEVAAMFLTKPDYYAVRLVARTPAGQPRRPLFQCSDCKAVFLDRPAAVNHQFEKHFEQFCRKEEKEVEPPKGSFTCVTRCRLSGTVMGPPNYHGFNERVLEMHRRRFAHLSLDAYRQQLETLHDPAAIEQWKDSMRKQTEYVFGADEQAVRFTRLAEAETHFREHCTAATIQTADHYVIPGAVSCALDDAVLRPAIREAWNRENRFPLKMAIVLRLAFRHFGLHTFKTGRGETYLTAILPSAMDPTHAIPVVREILEHTAAHPGCTRLELIGVLRPAAAGNLEAPEAIEILTQLRWLIEKGHLIEFSDGKLAVPASAVAHVQAARPHGHRHERPHRPPNRPPAKPAGAPPPG